MPSLTFHLIPHVHWDREWYLSRSGHLARLVPMMDRLLELLESDPALRFHLDGQTVLVADYLEVMPGSRGTVEALVRRGQLGIGPWYVLADELVPSGASLRKNLEIGIALARDLGGEVPVLYSPDAFGHPAGLPDLAADHGIGWAVVWRGLGRRGGRDRDLARWTGPGGGVVTVHHLPAAGYESGIGLVAAGDRLPAIWRRLRRELAGRAVTGEIAVFVGADHHGADPALGALAARIRALEPEAAVRFSGLTEYFKAVDAAVAAGARLGSVEGELRDSSGHAWSLQGTHGSRARLKRHHDRAAGRIGLAEGIAGSSIDPAGRALLDLAWRRLIESEFHDTLGGCCADPVAAEQAVRLDGVIAIADQVISDGFDRLAGHDPDLARDRPDQSEPMLVVANPFERERTGVVIAETTWFERDVLVGPPGDREPGEGLGYRAFHLVGPDGSPIPVQILRVAPGLERIDAPRHYPDLDLVDRVWIAAWLGPIDGRTAVRYRAAEGAIEIGDPSGAVVSGPGNRLTNGLVSITAEGNGFAASVHRRGTGYQDLFGVESESDRGDLYTPEPVAGTVRRAVVSTARVVATGPLVGALESRWTVAPAGGGIATGRTVVWMAASEAAVRVRIEWDNHATAHRLRLRIPAFLGGGGWSEGAARLLAGAPIGDGERRGIGRLDRSWPEEAVLPTAPASGFVASLDPERPVRVEREGFFEYQATSDGDLLVTLARSVGELSRDDLENRRGHAGWPMATPGAEEPGRHRVDLVVRFEAESGDPDLPVRWLRAGPGRDVDSKRPG